MISHTMIRRICKITAASLLLILTAVTVFRHLSVTGMESNGALYRNLIERETTTKIVTAEAPAPGAVLSESKEETNRIGDKCSRSDIVINQGPTSPSPNGIPTFFVEITNNCLSGCNISGIHLSCGWFSSAFPINPHIFKRIRYNNCLVNEGKVLINGRTLSFKYANTFPYPLSVSSIRC